MVAALAAAGEAGAEALPGEAAASGVHGAASGGGGDNTWSHAPLAECWAAWPAAGSCLPTAPARPGSRPAEGAQAALALLAAGACLEGAASHAIRGCCLNSRLLRLQPDQPAAFAGWCSPASTQVTVSVTAAHPLAAAVTLT